ncbi:MAG: right-handed parallel beta-helix repeat-containing protein [Anaerolineales bacterium]|nr:right-handed parallel beta-helix repeat-containing protein [Anaerolineales bacterium]
MTIYPDRRLTNKNILYIPKQEDSMRYKSNQLLYVITLSLFLSCCGTSPSTESQITQESVPSAQTNDSSAPTTQIPTGKTIVVSNVEDSGLGTLRQAILEADAGDTIEFDTAVFPPDQPKVIYLESMLPLEQGNLNIDATHAGVILDGSEIPEGFSAIQIFTDRNTISGFQVRNLHGSAIMISSGRNNLIQDNIIGGVADGVSIGGGTTSNNEISGNYIGVSSDGVTPLPNSNNGISIGEGA